MKAARLHVLRTIGFRSLAISMFNRAQTVNPYQHISGQIRHGRVLCAARRPASSIPPPIPASEIERHNAAFSQDSSGSGYRQLMASWQSSI